MARKTRLWKCQCCRIVYKRYKNYSEDHHAPRCDLCNFDMVRANKFPTPRKTRCRHEVTRSKRQKFDQNYRSRVRLPNGKIYRPVGEVKKLWKLIRKSKQRPAMMRKVEDWLTLLANDYDVEGYPKEFSGGEVRQSHRFVVKGVPELKVYSDTHTDSYHVLGSYKGLGGKSGTIKVSTGHSLDDVRDTVVHEALHWLDAVANMENNGHDYYWKLRLKEFRGHFPTEGL